MLELRPGSNILVTGGAGYIGSHICKALAEAGFAPVTYDNLVHGHRWAVKWGPFELGDVSDTARLSEVFDAHRPKAVIHLAAFAYVGESVSDPAKYYRNNVGGSLALLEAMRVHNVSQIVFSSTCATYGISDSILIKEDAPQRPINPYGASKLMVERMLCDFGSAYGLRSIALRYFNAAGADPDGDVGEAHEPETHLIPLVLDVAAGLQPDVTIYGADYETPDGTCIRDYIHVSDIADAHVLALKKLGTDTTHSAYNLGTGIGASVAEVIRTTRAVTGHDIPTIIGPRRAGDPASLLADASRAIRDLGWNPDHSDLTTMIETAWKWHLRHSRASQTKLVVRGV